MSLDIRIPIGLMFGVIGSILTIFGLVSDPKIYTRSLGININLGWGCILLAFSIFMLMMAYRAHKKQGKKS